jgi:predicted choloylglycine hydrolase
MQKRFVFEREDQPGEAWLARFRAGRDEARRWYLGEGRKPAATPVECRDALRAHMPELLPLYDRACSLVGDDAMGHCILSHYRPGPLNTGCSQAVWLGEGGPALIRNHDFPLHMITERFELSSWFGRKVIAKAQRPWGGCLDGMNEDGLAVSLTFGGTQAQGLGFSVILMLRYVLETCRTSAEAVAALTRIPIAQSQNVTVLDRSGAYATLFLGPDRAPAVTGHRVTTNHQEQVVWPERGEVTHTVARHDYLSGKLAEPGQRLEQLIESFLQPPLYSRWVKSTTAYTAVYRPAEGRVAYLWPGTAWSQSFDIFRAGEFVHDFGALDAEYCI